MFMMYSMICFTAFNPNAESRFTMGWVILVVVFQNLILHLIGVFKNMIKSYIQEGKDKYAKARAKALKKVIKKKRKMMESVFMERLGKHFWTKPQLHRELRRVYKEISGGPLTAEVPNFEIYKFLDMYLLFDNKKLDKQTLKYLKEAE